MRPLNRLLLAALVASMLSACGNKGDLILPPAKPGQPVKADAPAPPSTAGLDHSLGAPVGY